MQTLDVISVNIWQIFISLCNLLILFLILKKFLYKPVKRVLAERQHSIDSKYSEADNAVKAAKENRIAWEAKMQSAEAEADRIISDASASAERKSERIIADAREKAGVIVNEAETQAELELKKAHEEIKREIVDVSAVIAEKMLEREIKEDDHRVMIDSVISEIGKSEE